MLVQRLFVEVTSDINKTEYCLQTKQIYFRCILIYKHYTMLLLIIKKFHRFSVIAKIPSETLPFLIRIIMLDITDPQQFHF